MSLLNLLGADRTRRLLRSTAPGVERLRDEVERRTFDRSLQIEADRADFDAVSRGGVGAAWDSRGRVPPNSSFSGVAAADPIEPIVEVEVTWGDGTTMTVDGRATVTRDATVEHFAKVDRDAVTYQLHGRLRSIGEIRRAFSTDHTLQRTTTSVELENVDGHFNSRLLDKSWMGARVVVRVGYRTQPVRFWQQVAAPFLIESFDAASPTTVRMSLVDAVGEAFGRTVRLPVLRDIVSHSFRSALDRLTVVNTHAAYDSPPNRRLFQHLRSQPPVVGAGVDDITAHTGAAIAGMTGDALNRRIPMFFGRGDYVKPALTWVRGAFNPVAPFNMEDNPLAVIVLGASKKRGWIRPHPWFGAGADNTQTLNAQNYSSDFGLYVRKQPTVNQQAAQDAEGGRLVCLVDLGRTSSSIKRMGTSTHGIGGYVDVAEVEDSANNDGTENRWFVAFLVIGMETQLLSTKGDAYANQWREVLAHLQQAAANDEVFVSYPHGCEGDSGATPYSESIQALSSPAGALEHVVKHFAQGPSRNVDLDALRDLHLCDGLLGRRAAGVLYEDTPVEQLVNGICKTFRIDPFLTRSGKVSFRPPGPTSTDLLERRRGARKYRDEYEISRGSFRAWSPVGEDRWGCASIFAFTGLKEHLLLAAPGLAKAPSWRNISSDLGYREFDKRIFVGWLAQPTSAMAGNGEDWGVVLRDWATPFADARWLAEFGTHLVACTDDLGSLIRVSHFGAPSSTGPTYRGWTDRLCRIESIELELNQLVATVGVLDADEFDTSGRPWLLDDEGNWERVVPRSGELVDKTNGSPTIACTGWSPESYEVQAGDLFWIGTENGAAEACAIRIDAVGAATLTLAENYTGSTAASWSDFKILRSHETPPTNLEVLGAYPEGSEMYGRLCDELLTASDGTTGAMDAAGDPAYRLYE